MDKYYKNLIQAKIFMQKPTIKIYNLVLGEIINHETNK